MQVVPSASGTFDYALAPLPESLDTPPDVERLNPLHTLPPSWRDHCSTCSGDGYFKTRLKDDSVVTVECNCREQWILGRHMQASNIDDVYARMSWDRVRTVPEDVLALVREYVDDLSHYRRAGLGLTLWGDRRGTGKTMLTVLLLKEAMASGCSVYFTRFIDLITTYSRTWKNETTEAWFARSVERASVLGIDDIGKESVQTTKSAGMVDQLLDRMLRGRIANARTIIVSSNLNPASEKVGQGFDRYQRDVLELLSEANEPVEVGGVSYRRTSREQKIADVRDGVVYPLVVR